MAKCEKCRQNTATRTSPIGRKLCSKCYATMQGAAAGAMSGSPSGDEVIMGISTAGWMQRVRQVVGKK